MTLPTTAWGDEAKDGQYVILVDDENSMIDTEDDFVLVTEGEDATVWTDE